MKILRRLLLIAALLVPAGVAWAGPLPAVTSQDRFLGRADAPVTVVEYASFTCSHCAAWYLQVLPAFKARYIDTGKVRLVFRDLPTAPVDAAVTASGIARCAAPGRYFDVVHAFMDGQAELHTGGQTGAWYQMGVAASGRTEDQIQTCLADPDLIPRIRAEVQGGVDAGVEGTPTFFVNGRKLVGNSLDALSAAIDPLLDAR